METGVKATWLILLIHTLLTLYSSYAIGENLEVPTQTNTTKAFIPSQKRLTREATTAIPTLTPALMTKAKAAEDDEIPYRPKKPRRRKPRPRPDDYYEYDEDEEEDTDRRRPNRRKDKDREDDELPDIPSGNKPSRRPRPGGAVNAKPYFEETFSERTWDTTWVYSKMDYGLKQKKKFEKFFRIRSNRGGKKGYDYGLVTSDKGNEEYAISASFPPVNSNDGPLVIQFTMQYLEIPHCEYVYLKLFDCKFKGEEFTSDTPPLIQFGPDICSPRKRLVVVLTDPIKGDHYVVSRDVAAITTKEVHMYTFIIHPDGAYEILVNGHQKQNGTLAQLYPSYHYQGYPSICAVGMNIWHSILDKFFNGQIIVDDVLITSNIAYAEKKRMEILDVPVNNATA